MEERNGKIIKEGEIKLIKKKKKEMLHKKIFAKCIYTCIYMYIYIHSHIHKYIVIGSGMNKLKRENDDDDVW